MPARASAVAVASAVGLVAAALVSGPALASAPTTAGHRGGKVEYPTVQAAAASRAARGASSTTVNGSGNLTYGGGVNGIGVTTGTPRVYFVFWGSQWGTQSTDASGNLVFSGDTKGMAPYLQKLFKGIGTESGSSTWSGVMTQYCEGIATGASSCPATSSHVGVPKNGAFAGAWYDGAAAAPSQATDNQIGVEAHAALVYFQSQGSVDLRNAQFVVVSPSGTHPGGFNTGFRGPQFCAWHDWNGDTTLNGGAVSSPEGDFAFTNMPYVTDLGTSCGANYVNSGSAGALDGVSIVEGHEYAETITDQFPAGGWTDSQGYENADKCAWVGTGGTGGAQDVTFTTGSFAMQGTYSNDGSACLIAHPVVTNASATYSITVGGLSNLSGTTTFPITPFTATATEQPTPPSPAITFSATGLPAGVTISADGTVSGTPTVSGSGTYTVTATDSSTGAVGSSSASWSFTTVVSISPVNVSGPDTIASPRNSSVSLQMSGTSTASASYAALTWTATGVPSGITLNSSTGLFSGKAPRKVRNYSVTVTAKDLTGSVGKYTFTWQIT